MTQHNSAKGKIIGAIVVIVVVGLVAWWYLTRMPGVDFSRHGPEPSRPAAASTAPPPIEHPISKAETGPAPATTLPLPPLGTSDNAVAAALASLPGAQGLANLLIAHALIPHIVATVDALPRHSIGTSIVPMHTPKGDFVVSNVNGQSVIGTRNYARYDPYMKIVQDVSARDLVTWYVHWYPLFQQAYRELGYPHGYFNDRLIVAIDNLLAAPNARPPVALVATDAGQYAYADPTWEGLSVGQKLMIRIGPGHERVLKTKLRSIRALLLGKAPELRAALSLQPPGASASSAPAPASTTH